MEQGTDMTNIPKARAILTKASAEMKMGCCVREAIKDALDLMTRKVSSPRVSKNTVTMTQSIGAAARRIHRTTDLTQAEIAQLLNVNPGRVNEALNGMWE
jgi:predicted XRE-type DNA-binding protein